jgi:hypothetical protein
MGRRWARLSAGREVTLLSSHAGRSGAPDRRQNTQTADTKRGHRYAEPTRRACPKHDTEPLCATHKFTSDQSVGSSR